MNKVTIDLETYNRLKGIQEAVLKGDHVVIDTSNGCETFIYNTTDEVKELIEEHNEVSKQREAKHILIRGELRKELTAIRYKHLNLRGMTVWQFFKFKRGKS